MLCFGDRLSPSKKKKKVISHKVKVLDPSIKGCLKPEVILLADQICPVQLSVDKTYLITAKMKKAKTIFIISSCSYIHEKKSDMSPLSMDLLWLNSQMGGCGKKVKCVDGSTPHVCGTCPSQEEISRFCPIAETCIMNKCAACRPQFFDKDGNRVCDDCPLGQDPLPCPKGSVRCAQAIPPTCEEASQSDLLCVPWGCGSCTTLWINNVGKQVCKSESVFNQCLDLSSINFGSCKGKLAIKGFGMENRECTAIQGCESKINDLVLFGSMNECKQVCQATVEDNNGTEVSENALCDPNEEYCCPDGQVEDICVYKNLLMYCKFVTCEGTKAAKCTSDPCDKCKVQLEDEAGEIIDPELCQLDLPDYRQCTPLAEVTCPSEQGEPNCGPLPSACPNDWNARCVIDPCSCNPIWMNEDIRDPSNECLRALVADCVMEEECPTEFKCLPSIEEIKSEQDFAQGFDLQCIQEPCTCVPMWHMYDISVGPMVIPGFREKCKKYDEQCCEPGNFKPKNCTQLLKYNEQICQQMKCTGVTVDQDSCETDVCDDCNIKAKSLSGARIMMGTCSFQTLQEECALDPSITCAGIPIDCGPFPKVCPTNWNIKCVLDPCVCRPFWLDMDVRYTQETCKMALEPPCIPFDECPTLNCPPLTEQQAQGRTQQEIDNLVCVPQPCTCRPILVANFPHTHPHGQSQHTPEHPQKGQQQTPEHPRRGGQLQRVSGQQQTPEDPQRGGQQQSHQIPEHPHREHQHSEHQHSEHQHSGHQHGG